jgi:hypothetical protein
MPRSSEPMEASCRCGQVKIQLAGPPIMRVACYCASCRTAGQALAEEFGAPPVVDHNGGTDLVLYRKDRVTQTVGVGQLAERRLKPESPTRRMVATCCGAPMALDFTKGHWLSVYRDRLPGEVPALEACVMTQDKLPTATLPANVPAYATHSGKTMGKLLSAWAAMGFRRPRVDW